MYVVYIWNVSSLESLYGGQITLSTLLIKPNTVLNTDTSETMSTSCPISSDAHPEYSPDRISYSSAQPSQNVLLSQSAILSSTDIDMALNTTFP